jgi:tRNA(Ile)-lysidine synthase
MARSHPPTLATLTERTLREECDLERGARILVAISGGGDSMALLHVLAGLAKKLGLSLFAHGVDHGLRPEAKAELDLAEALAERLGIPFSRTRVRLAPGGNVQSRARKARYDSLQDAMRRTRTDLLATAHHADDRAETVLDRLLRGSGPRGLAVLPARSGDRIRPFLRARRADVRAHLERHGIAFASDPSNLDRRYLRVRLRLEVLPLLEELSPGVVGHLNALADQIAGPAPLTLFDQWEPVTLSRAQATEVRRLLEKRLVRGMVPLPGGRLVRVDPERGVPVVQHAEHVKLRRRASEGVSKRRKVINSR